MKNKLFIIFIVASVIFILFGGYHYNNKLDNIATNSNNAKTVSQPESVEKEEFSQENIYVYSNNGEINIYVKGSNDESDRYIGYNIKHLKRELDKEIRASNYDVWKLDGAGEYVRIGQDRFNRQTTLVSPGEWDLAIQESGANDFVGGALHGDEITSSVELLLDGNKIDPYGDSVSQEFKELKLVVESDLFRDNTISENEVRIATHFKEYTFNKDGLTVVQEVEFTESLTLNKSYLAMLPILRENDGKQITDTVTTSYDNREYNVSEPGFDIPEVTNVKADKVEISGKESGISATVEIIDRSPSEIPHSFTLSNSELYNKLYFAFVDASNGRHTTTIGDVWKQTVHYQIDTSN